MTTEPPSPPRRLEGRRLTGRLSGLRMQTSGLLVLAGMVVTSGLAASAAGPEPEQDGAIGPAQTQQADPAPAPGGVDDGLEYWIRPDDMTVSDTGRVTNWDDVHRRHTDEVMLEQGFSRSDGFNFHPTASTPGNAYMRFTHQQMLSGADAGEAFSMLQSTGAHDTDDGYPTEFGGGGSAQTWEYDWRDSQVYSGWGSTTRQVWNPLLAPAGGPARNVLDPHIYNVVSRPGEWTARFDGVTNFTTATNTPNFSSSPSSHTYVGASHHSRFRGKLSELTVYRRDLSDAERRRVQSYFATKYGVTLGTPGNPVAYVASDGTTVYWDDPAHHNDVAGIGRDDASLLNQKQSGSINHTNVVTIGLGSIEASNDANTRGFDADRSFMVWGHDAGAANAWVDAGTADSEVANYRRIPRTWKVQDTGAVGEVAFDIDVDNPFADIPAAIDGYYLLRDSDIDGDLTDETPVALTDVGDGRFRLSGVDFRDGETFTIATFAADYGVNVRVMDNLTGEDGDTGSFHLRLAARPRAPVAVGLVSSNAAEGTVPEEIVIQPANWDDYDANVVTVTGADDDPAVVDGAVQYSAVTSEVTSDDPAFDALGGDDVDDVAMVNLNDDGAGVKVAAVDGHTTSEEGACTTVTFALLSRPADPVTVPLSVDKPAEANLGGVAEVTITPERWNSPKDNGVPVCGSADDVVDGDVEYALVTGDPASLDPDYDAITADGVADVSLVNVDAEPAASAPPDGDSDGVPDSVEDAAPGTGDGNKDGIPDDTQSNVASFVNSATAGYTVLSLDTSCQIRTADVAAEAATAAADPAFEYPFGLMNFTADCGTPGYTATVVLRFYGSGPSDLVMRKFLPATGAYRTIEEADLRTVGTGGEEFIQASFPVTDGGAFDADGQANGTIVDPAGPAAAAAPGPSPVDPQDPAVSEATGGVPGGLLPVTGSSTLFPVLLAAGLLITGRGCRSLSRSQRVSVSGPPGRPSRARRSSGGRGAGTAAPV